MKRIYSVLLIAVLFAFQANAQVTIGGGTIPQKGAVLDLNAAFNGGLLLPNVAITDLGRIPGTFSDADVRNVHTVSALTGLVVYNTNAEASANIYKGIYVWDGEDWQLLVIDSEMMSIPAETPGYAQDYPLVADEFSTTGEITISNPSLDIAGQYSFAVIAGAEFSSVSATDLEQGIFSVEFQANPTAYKRRCVVLATDPAGRTATFTFTQAAAECSVEVTPAVDTYGSTELCQNGAVHAYVSSVSAGSVSDYDYFWVRNGIEVAHGAGVELKQAGVYSVYAAQIGCGTPAEINITADNSTATLPPRIIADNNGILCGTAEVTLSAINAPTPATGLIWLKDGLKQAENTASHRVTASEENQGNWYLVYNNGGCSSVSGNKINIVYNTGNTALPAPDARINDISISNGSITVCAGGTLKLSVANPSAYSTFNNVEYEWFGNGQSLGKTTSATMYVVPPTFTRLVISLTVTATDQCPMSETSEEFTVLSGSTPPATSINRGSGKAFICAAHPAVLTAGATGSAFQWLKNGVVIDDFTGKSLAATEPGYYTVRYSNTEGCWSTVSAPVEVIQSAPVSVIWQVMPGGTEITQSSKTYSVIVAPAADAVEWSPVNPAHASVASIMPLGNAGNATAAIFNFGNEEANDYQIKVSATNACGTAELLSGLISVEEGCMPAGSVVITPNATQAIEEGQSITFKALANTGSAPIYYKWFVDNVEQVNAGNDTFMFTPMVQKTTPGYSIIAKAYAECDETQAEATSAPVLVPVIVNIDPSTLLPLPNPETVQPHFTTGKTCLDVHATDGNAADNPWADGGRLPLTLRPNDFNNGNTLAFTYHFSTVGGNNIRFMVNDPQSIVQSVNGDANASQATAVVTFQPNIRTAAAGTTKNTAIPVTLYAVYSVGGQNYEEHITINVQDQSCGCPAKVSANAWQMFQCHNAGADTSIDPFSISNTSDRVNLRGAWYAWGRKNPARDRYSIQPQPRPVRHNTSVTAWPSWENPCEPGWKSAPKSTWQEVFNQNTRTRPNAFLQFGSYLILPPQGYAASIDGNLIVPDEFHYWTGTNSSATAGHNFYAGGSTTTTPAWGNIVKYYIEPVRCIQQGAAYGEND